MQFVLLGGIFATFAVTGYIFYRNYVLRKKYFESLIGFCNNLTTEINFSKKNISLIIDDYINNYCASFKSDLECYKNLIDNNKDLGSHTTKVETELWNKLAETEKTIIWEFLCSLGRHSSIEELQKIKNYKSRFEKWYEVANEKVKKEASITLKISILLGIAVVILLL